MIKICLEEIDRSRPYFVCSLGFRNGWSLQPDDDPKDPGVVLLNKTLEIGNSAFNWIEGKRDRSVTELGELFVVRESWILIAADAPQRFCTAL